jgi:muramoyltetrapeptide carboxypeptidase
MKLTEAINTVKSAPIKIGDTIGITAPSSQIDIGAVSSFAKLLTDIGFKIQLGETITYVEDKDYNSADAQTRAKDFNRMVNDKNVDAIWVGAGGFGAQMTAEYLDYEAISNNPKPIIGFSDTTFLLNAIQEQTGLVTFLGPTAEYTDKDRDGKSNEYALQILSDNIEYPHEVNNFKSTIIRRISNNMKSSVGKIVGGNLTMVQTSLSTDYEIDTDGKILVLEEVGESSYSIERALDHLKSAGKLNNLAGLIFGEFNKIKREGIEDSHDGNPSINEILVKKFKNAPYPVLIGYTFSHGHYNLTLPIGGLAKIDGDSRTLTILESPLK